MIDFYTLERKVDDAFRNGAGTVVAWQDASGEMQHMAFAGKYTMKFQALQTLKAFGVILPADEVIVFNESPLRRR